MNINSYSGDQKKFKTWLSQMDSYVILTNAIDKDRKNIAFA